jgi:lysine 2,3-aminomutase
MSSLASSKVNAVIKHDLHFHRTYVAMKVFNRDFSTSQVSTFRLSTLQNGQAGLARAPEREYLPEDTRETSPGEVIHHSVTPKLASQHVDNPQKRVGKAKVQETSKPRVKETSSLPGSGIGLASVPAYFRGAKFDPVPYWQKIERWKDISEKQFLSYRWGVSQTSLLVEFDLTC